MQTTLLSTLISRMQRNRVYKTIEEQDIVRDLDESLRKLMRHLNTPWRIKQSTLKVFDSVYEYSMPSDYDELAYLDTNTNMYFPQSARFTYTSLTDFYQDPTNRSMLAEIWSSGTKYLGVNYKNNKYESSKLNSANDATQWTVTGDASTPEVDNVNFKEGTTSIKTGVTGSGNFTIVNTITANTSDANYKTKYHFKWVYLVGSPTTLRLQLRTDGSNYLYTNITTQFSGQPFIANGWNLIAQNLDTATEVGTFDYNNIDSEAVVMTGATAGTYYFDTSYTRQWELLNLWYYTKYNVGASEANPTLSQQFFMNSADVYDTGSVLVGDLEWADVIMYEAMITGLTDKENANVLSVYVQKKEDAWKKLKQKYPDSTPIIVTNRYRFTDNFNDYIGWGYNNFTQYK